MGRIIEKLIFALSSIDSNSVHLGSVKFNDLLLSTIRLRLQKLLCGLTGLLVHSLGIQRAKLHSFNYVLPFSMKLLCST